MAQAARPKDEAERLKALRSCKILDTPPEEVLDSITQLAAYICGKPIALISMVDEARQWFKARVGFELAETPREHSFCAHTVLESGLLVVKDATQDARFSDNPLVTAPPRIRFYAGVPLILPGGHALGALCVMDTVPGDLDEAQRNALVALAHQVAAAIETRRAFSELASTLHELRRAEDESQKSQAKFSKIFQSSPDAITLTSATDGRYIDVNDAFVRVTGYSREEVLGKTSTELKIWADPRYREELLARVRAGGLVRDFEFKFRTKSGEVRTGMLSAEAIEIAGISCILLIGRDISQQKESERALKETAERHRLLFERNLAAVYRTTFDGGILDCNHAFARLLGYASRDDMLTQNAWAYIPKSERDSFLNHVLNERFLNNYELCLHRKDGSVVWTLQNVSLVASDNEPGEIEGTVIDITRYKKLEEQFWQSQKMEGIGRLAGGIAHDFNNLLSIITGYTHLLLEKLDPATPSRTHAVNVLKASERAAGLIRQLLAFSRRQIMEPKILDLNRTITDLGKMLHHMIGEDIELKIVPRENLGWVKADPGQIEQVLMNLVVNARDAMPRGGTLTIETANLQVDGDNAHIYPSLKPGRYVVCSVSDTGTGMTEEIRNHLFEPFFTTKEAGRGTGLGLSTAYGIVEQSEGHISVRSESGKGATFEVLLPRVEPAERGQETGVEPPSPRGIETVLLVEDEDSVREVALLFLQSQGYKVVSAKSGADALETVRHYPGEIHLLLTDVVMPGMNGRDLASRLQQIRPDIKILYMSGYPELGYGHSAVANLGAPVVPKPFTVDSLARSVRASLDQRAA